MEEKKLDTVSYDLFDEMYCHYGVFLDRLNLLTKLGMSYGEYEGVLDLICHIVEHEAKSVDSFFDRAISERGLEAISGAPDSVKQTTMDAIKKINDGFATLGGAA